ncbi:MAG: DUF3987 domain-containing protein [Bacteroidales bacterium]|nr:DUF3987 domain-containing protein [Bacteroidales bacterium]
MKRPFYPQQWKNDDIPNAIEELTSRIEQAAVDIAPTYNEWLQLGFALVDALGENGRPFFQRLSRFYHNYTEKETNEQYSRCLSSNRDGITIKTLFYLAKKAGINILLSKTPKLLTDFIGIIDNFGDLPKKEMPKSSISPKSPIFSPLTICKEEPMPTFSNLIKDNLPYLLSQIVGKAKSDEDADLLILGSITVFSACLPNIYGVYNKRDVYPNLFVFITAQASAGKGRLSLCRKLVEPIQKHLRETNKAEYEDYKRKQAEYVANRKNHDYEQPEEPPLRTLFMPANSSATSVYKVLNDNEGVGLMFETEGDTLANTFNSDFGNFSDGLRKAFHHEPISYNRRKENEFVELDKPKFSVLLSGTPRQITNLIPDAENGLFSRFLFYYMNIRMEWDDVFSDDDDCTDDSSFELLGHKFEEYYNSLKAMKPMRFCFTEPQRKEFNEFFKDIQQNYASILGLDILGSIRRLGIITFRIAMILSTLRMCDTGNYCTPIVCSDADFRSAITMAKILLRHTEKVFCSLPGNDKKDGNQDCSGQESTRIKQIFLDNLPNSFDRKQFQEIAQALTIPETTADRFVKNWCQSGIIIHSSHGKYERAE